MTYIEGHWETINSLKDVSRVIREYYNEELADEMDELILDLKYPEYDLERAEELEEIVEEIRKLVL